MKQILAIVVVASACASGSPDPHRRAPPSVPFARMSPIWHDATRCQELVAAGRVERKEEGAIRLAVWNVRWFPDGTIRGVSRAGGTDLEWLACALAHLNADVIALQEFKRHARAREALDRVDAALEALSGGVWEYVFDDCPGEDKQHVGFFYRSDRVELTELRTEPYLDPTSDGRDARCGEKRPALLAYVRSTRGSLDFNLATVHLDSGREPSDFAHRRESWRRMEEVVRARTEATVERDFVFAGDFNTMGCGDCGIADSPAEIELFTRTLASQRPALRVLPASVPCTEYYGEHGSVLDHVVVSSAFEELLVAQTRVSGACGDLACRAVSSRAMPVFQRLSDHCPLLVDFRDVDLDPPPPTAEVR